MDVKKSHLPIGTVAPGGEPKLTIRIIRRCNFHCPACSTFSSPEGKGLLSLSDFKKITNSLLRENFRGVINISGGEPALHPRLIKMLHYASECIPEAKIVVFTNGSWIGQRSWRQKLKNILSGPNVLLRFSLDREHALGALATSEYPKNNVGLKKVEQERFQQAKAFIEACLDLGVVPGVHFDFAFKGTKQEAKSYMFGLGDVPVYMIEFQRNPACRPKRLGYFAIDIDTEGRPLVFPTLGHIPTQESLGGIETVPVALSINRRHNLT
jgi:organic radical activating enzyme